jgi:heme/copper-type cytochrome/quinol oxidase subunit 1
LHRLNFLCSMPHNIKGMLTYSLWVVYSFIYGVAQKKLTIFQNMLFLAVRWSQKNLEAHELKVIQFSFELCMVLCSYPSRRNGRNGLPKKCTPKKFVRPCYHDWSVAKIWQFLFWVDVFYFFLKAVWTISMARMGIKPYIIRTRFQWPLIS